ncbi:MAG: lysostaphin resistance A-like protein [Akkermansiaceae bacterium]
MQRLIQSDLTKVILFFILTIVTAAAISPWLYNAGMLLAEVRESRSLNPILDSLADCCNGVTFSSFYLCSMLGCALVLAGPFVMWCQLKHPSSGTIYKPWRLQLPRSSISGNNGQSLSRNPQADLHLGAGFLIMGGVMAISFLLLKKIGWFSMNPEADYGMAVGYAMVSAIFTAIISESLFRGVIMGICLRSMGPALAIISSSVIYATVLSVTPPKELVLKNPEMVDAGFRMLKATLQQLLTPEKLAFGFITLFSFGLVMAYARYRTASLWLPIGLHIGMTFSQHFLEQTTVANTQLPAISKLLIGGNTLSGLLPLCILIVTTLLIHIFIQISRPKPDTDSS